MCCSRHAVVLGWGIHVLLEVRANNSALSKLKLLSFIGMWLTAICMQLYTNSSYRQAFVNWSKMRGTASSATFSAKVMLHDGTSFTIRLLDQVRRLFSHEHTMYKDERNQLVIPLIAPKKSSLMSFLKANKVRYTIWKIRDLIWDYHQVGQQDHSAL